MNRDTGDVWEFESGKRKRQWQGSSDAGHAAAVLGQGEKMRALVQLFIEDPNLREQRDGLVDLLKQTVPLLDMPASSVEGCRGGLGQRAYHIGDKHRLNPISADLSHGPDAYWYMRPEARAAFALVL